MSTFLSSFSCCWLWFLLGALLGWLLNWWLCKSSCKPNSGNQARHLTGATGTGAHSSTTPNATPTKLAAVPASPAPAAASTAPVAKPVPAPAPTPAPTPASAPTPAPKPAAPVSAAIDLAAAKAAGFTLKNANDLTVVEGIGPKINELFNKSGVTTFAQLAAQTLPQMRKVLDDGGSRFRIANPSTWAQQAALAAANKWTELKKLQDGLSGGVKK